MKVAHIVPTSLLDLTKYNEYHLILPHLLDTSKEYYDFYQKVEGPKILDNGAAEGVPCDWQYLINLAMQMSVHEVIIPDFMGDCDRTIELAKQFGEQYGAAKATEGLRFTGVIQGKSISEVMKCFQFYEASGWVSKISLPRILSNTIDREFRVSFLQAFYDQIMERFGPVHCLGGSGWMEEVKYLAKLGDVVQGIDTSLCAVMGLDSRRIDFDEYVGRQAGFFEATAMNRKLMYIEHNISVFNHWASGND